MENLWGISQTKPGHKGQITLSVGPVPDSKKSKNSAGFSVAAIPISVTEKKIGGFLQNRKAGMTIEAAFTSDSGNPNDINKTIQVLEKVKEETVTGAWAKLTIKIDAQKDYLTIEDVGEDEMTLPLSWLNLAIDKNMTSDAKVYQAWLFNDLITGSENIPIPNSGFLRYFIMPKPDKGTVWKYLAENTGSTTKGTKVGIEVAAGSTDPAAGLQQPFDVSVQGQKLIVKEPD